MLNPTEPLFGRKLRLIADGPKVILAMDERGISVMLRRSSTSLLPFVVDSPRAKLSRVAVVNLQALVKENGLCPAQRATSGSRSVRRSSVKS